MKRNAPAKNLSSTVHFCRAFANAASALGSLGSSSRACSKASTASVLRPRRARHRPSSRYQAAHGRSTHGGLEIDDGVGGPVELDLHLGQVEGGPVVVRARLQHRAEVRLGLREAVELVEDDAEVVMGRDVPGRQLALRSRLTTASSSRLSCSRMTPRL